MEFSRGYGDHVAKSRNFRGGGGCPARPSGTEICGGWGVKLKKSSVGGGGYGYFLEPHIVKSVFSFCTLLLTLTTEQQRINEPEKKVFYCVWASLPDPLFPTMTSVFWLYS